MTATLTERTTATRTGVPIAYERISKFRVNRDGLDVVVTRNINRQVEDNNRAARDMFGEPIPEGDHFTDDNRSASQFATKERERWLALLERVRSGSVSHVLVWLFDRAARTTEDTERLLQACRDGDALIVQTAASGRVVADPHNPDDVFRLKLAGLLAEYEVAKMSVRQRRAKVAAAEKGVAHGGRRRYGYEPGMTAIRESEAVVIRDLVNRLLAGESLYRLALDLQERGVPTAEGGTWTGPNLRNMIRRPHLAGLRVHRGEVVGDAAWPGIITRTQHDAVVALLSNPARRMSGSNARKYLLAGLALCDECGEPVRGKPATSRGVAASYTCRSNRHVHRSIELVDDVVERAIVGRLARYDASGLLVDDSEAEALARMRADRAALDDRYEDVVAEHAAGRMTTRAYSGATTRLEADMDQLDAAIREASALAGRASRVLDGLTGERAAEAWANLPLDRRRAVIGELCEVRLVGGRTGGKWRPEDVRVIWR